MNKTPHKLQGGRKAVRRVAPLSWRMGGGFDFFAHTGGFAIREKLFKRLRDPLNEFAWVLRNDHEIQEKIGDLKAVSISVELKRSEYGNAEIEWNTSTRDQFRSLIISALERKPVATATRTISFESGRQLDVSVVFSWPKNKSKPTDSVPEIGRSKESVAPSKEPAKTRDRQPSRAGSVSNSIVELFKSHVATEVERFPTATYDAHRNALLALHDTARETIASALEPMLNERAASMPQNTYEEKKSLARWVNAELRRFGLALKSDRTDRPCILVGNPGNRPENGRFMLQYADERGQLHHPLTSVTLPRLELMLDDLTRATYAGKGRGR